MDGYVNSRITLTLAIFMVFSMQYAFAQDDESETDREQD
jgi:hypothetical protein